MSPRAIQQAPFRVLVGANMPAVLVEMAFLSNPQQEREAATDTFQNAIVQALVERHRAVPGRGAATDRRCGGRAATRRRTRGSADARAASRSPSRLPRWRSSPAGCCSSACRAGMRRSRPLPSPRRRRRLSAERKITATLYYVSDDGSELIGVQREVPFGEPVLEQARRIIEAQIAPAAQPLASAVPAGTTLRSLYLTDKGDAFVDLSGEVRTKHPGGALDELLTVYTIVNVLTVNLPAIQRVQILIDGKEVDTLAGHVDLRHPLQKQLKWVKADKES